MRNKIIQGDTIEQMKLISDGSVDMILVDLPYGTTGLKWDTLIPFDQLWEQYNRIIKRNGAICCFASQPFSSALAMSNPKMFRYEWIWVKNQSTGFPNARKMPMKKHEQILVFYKHLPTYNAQGLVSCSKEIFQKKGDNISETFNGMTYGFRKGSIKQRLGNEFKSEYYKQEYTNWPNSILEFKGLPSAKRNHPTEKPVLLLEYLIKTYSNDGELILDNTCGSGSTGVACVNTGRDYIMIEKDEKYYNKSVERIDKAIKAKNRELF